MSTIQDRFTKDTKEPRRARSTTHAGHLFRPSKKLVPRMTGIRKRREFTAEDAEDAESRNHWISRGLGRWYNAPMPAPRLTDQEMKAIGLLKNRLTELLGERLRRIVLFGSKARGDFDEDSDLDLAILVHDLDRQSKRQIIDVVAEVELELLTVLSTLVMSTSDFERMKKREIRLAEDIEREGIPL
jgi:uncharacterized protein